VTLVNDPTRRTIVVNRGIPSTLNAPSLDGGSLAAFMYDLRNNDLEEQALGAIHGHAKSTIEPKLANTLISETDANNDPRYIFRVDNGAGDVRQVISPDPGHHAHATEELAAPQ
jgi:hypothetical protein